MSNNKFHSNADGNLDNFKMIEIEEDIKKLQINFLENHSLKIKIIRVSTNY